MSPVTKHSSSYYFDYGGQRYKVIDCPGFMDNEEKNQHQVLSEICRAGVLAREGLDAIVFVIDGGSRFSDQRHEQAIYILNTLGETFWKYSFIIFTHEADMKDQNNPSSDAYLQSYFNNPDCSDTLKRIFSRVDGRNMKIELASSEYSQNNEYWEEKLLEFGGQVSNIRAMNGIIRFDCELMHSGKDLYTDCFGLLMEGKSLQKKLDDLEIELRIYTPGRTQFEQQIIECEAKKKELKNEKEDIQNRIDDVRSKLSERVHSYEVNSMKKWFTLSNIAAAIALFGIIVLKIVTK